MYLTQSFISKKRQNWPKINKNSTCRMFDAKNIMLREEVMCHNVNAFRLAPE